MKQFALLFTFFLFGRTLDAQNLYWSGTHNWNLTLADWGTVSTGPYTTSAWVSGATANFVGTAGTVTFNPATSSITAASTNFNVTGYSLTQTAADTLRSPIVLGNNVNLSLMPSVSTIYTQAGSISGGTGSSLTLSGTTLTAAKITRINMYEANTGISVPTTINLVGSASNANIVGVVSESTGVGISGNVTLNGTIGGGRAMFGATVGDSLNLTGQISGTGDIQISLGTNGGAGMILFGNPANNFTGNLYMVATVGGTVKAGTASAVCVPSTMGLYYPENAYGGVFDMNGNNVTISALSTVGGNVGGVTNNGTTATLTVNQIINTSFGLVLSNGTTAKKLALTKSGTGILTLTGINTYTGATTVNAGSLLVDTGSLAPGSAVAVASAGTIGGNGADSGTVALSGTVSPGATGSGSAGTFTTGAQTWSTGAVYQCDIAAATGVAGTDWDLLTSTGNIKLTGGGFILNVNGNGITGFSNTGSYTWEIMSAGSFTGWSASDFTLNVTGFPTYTGAFTIVKNGTAIDLVYTPQPVAPVAQASNVIFSNIGFNGFTVNWTNGNGSSRIVVISPDSATAVAPANNTVYAASTVYGTDSTGANNYVIYNGAASGPVTVTGLADNTAYTVEVYEYNSNANGEAYNTSVATNNPYDTSTLIPVYYWNGGSPTAGSNVTANGGTAQWQVTNAWVEPTNPGTGATWVDGSIAVLGGTAGKVTLTQNQVADSVQVNTSGYTFTQNSATSFTGPINLASGVNLNIYPNIVSATTYNGNITGDSSTGITLNSSGLASGKVSKINLGQAGSVISAPVTVTLSNNDSTYAGFVATANNITISGGINLTTPSGGGRTILAATGSHSLRVSGPITGTGDIQFSDGITGGTGNLYLEDTLNSFTGDIYMAGAAGGTIYAGDRNAGTCIPTTAHLYLGAAAGFGGYLDLNGNHVTVSGLMTTAPGAVGGVINSGNFNRTLTIDQTDTTNFGLVIQDGVNAQTIVGKKGAGILTLSALNTFTGGLNMYGGTVELGTTNALANGLPLLFNGGKFSTGDTTGYSNVLGTLTLNGNGTILLGTGSHSLVFAGSDTITWATGKTLTIDNWTGVAGSSGTGGRIFFGTDATGLTAAQLSQITFNGYLSGATILNTGEIVPLPGSVWLGSTSTDWNTAPNWSTGAVPSDCSEHVIIPAGTAFAPDILSGAAYAGMLTISAGVNLTIAAGATLSVCDSLTGGAGSNAIVSGGGILILSGTNGQVIGGNLELSELNISDSSGVTFQSGSSVTIDNALDLQTGVMNTGGGSLILNSTSSAQIAIIDNFSSGFTGTIAGNITANRYYDYSGYTTAQQQHEIGMPVTGVSFSQFGAGGAAGYVIPQSNCDELSVRANSPNGKVYSFHEANGATCGMAQWYVEPGSNTAQPAQGYSIILPSNGGSGVLSVTGAPNMDSSYTLNSVKNSNWTNSTAEHHTLSSGWQLVSNPYMATLQIATANGGIDNQVQVWQANGSYVGTYQPGMVNSNAIIAPFQAFMVHVTTPGNTTSYTINAGDRVRTAHTFYALNANELDITATNLGNNLMDKTVIAFNPQATDTFDAQLDADKFIGALNRHTLYSTNNGKWMAINVLHDVATTASVPVGFESGATGSYSLSFGGINSFDATTYVTLEDKLLNIMYNVRNGDYRFSADSADDWDRFVLHFTPPAVVATANATCSAPGNISITQPGTANWTYVLTDSNSNVVASGVLNQSNSISVSAATGNYTLTLTDTNGYVATKSIEVGGAVRVTAMFNVPTVSVETATPVSFTNASLNANTFSWNFGDGSTSTLENPSYTYNTPGVYTITMTAYNATCSASYTQLVTVNAATTAVNTLTENGLNIWSNNNKVMVDFSQISNVDALIKIYNILGQTLSEEKHIASTLYQKEIDNIDAAYVIVWVNNNGAITTKKLFITNISK